LNKFVHTKAADKQSPGYMQHSSECSENNVGKS